MNLLLRLDGQNFDNTISDCDDLSTLRGGSLALLAVPRALAKHLKSKGYKVEVIYSGASEGLFRITLGSETQERLEEEVNLFLAGRADPTEPYLKAILPFLTIAWSLAEENGDDLAHNRSLANRNRIKQYQQPTVDLLPKADPVHLPCAVDRLRPGTEADYKGGDKQKVSASVRARREFGREQRQSFYKQELTEQAVSEIWGEEPWFAQSFEELVRPWGQGKNPLKISEKLVNKMAVLYADGNGFGSIPQKKAEALSDLTEFSEFVKNGRRALLRSVLKAMRGKNWLEGGKVLVPLETLLWGGDEFLFVMPAWTALDVLAAVEESLRDEVLWTFKGQVLKHSVGLVICHHHTPIREAKRLARQMADNAKDLKDGKGDNIGRERSFWQYQILQGIDPPPDLDRFRQALYKTSHPAAFSLDFQGGLAQALEAIRFYKTGGQLTSGVPLGRLLDLLHTAQTRGLLKVPTTSEAFKDWQERFDQLMARYSQNEEQYGYDFLATPNLGNDDQRPFMPLINLTQLWDYVDPIPQGGKKGGGV